MLYMLCKICGNAELVDGVSEEGVEERVPTALNDESFTRLVLRSPGGNGSL